MNRFEKRAIKLGIKYNPSKVVNDNYKEGKKVLLLADDTYRPAKVLLITSRRPNIVKDHILYFKLELLNEKKIVEVTSEKVITYMPQWKWWLKTNFPFLITENDYK